MAEARCICRDSISPACPRCGPYAQRAGLTLQAPPRPPLPSLQERYPEEAAMVRLWQAAEASGWVPDMHFFPTARYRALWAEFIRGTEVLRVLIHQQEKPLTRDQHLWLDTLRQTGKFEVYACDVATLEPILQRFAQEGS